MKSFQYVIKDRLGIHARPAGLLVKESINFQSTILIKKGDKEASASRIMQLMGLGVKNGDEVTVTVEGADEEKAFAAMKQFFQERF